MGDWAKADFGASRLPRTCIMLGGTNPKSVEKRVVRLFDDAVATRNEPTHTYLVRKGRKKYALMFNVYGPALAVDSLHVLNDGGCRELIFLGYAWCRKGNSRVGDYILPSRTYVLDGFTNILSRKTRWATADNGLWKMLEQRLKSLRQPTHTGVTISVPSVFRRPPEFKELVRRLKAIAIELELASILHFSKKLGIQAAGLLVVSDTTHQHLWRGESRRGRAEALIRLVKQLV